MSNTGQWMRWCACVCMALAMLCVDAQGPELMITPSPVLHTLAQMHSVYGMARDAAGDIYVADADAQVVRRIDSSSGAVSVIAGNGGQGFAGDGGKAVDAELNEPSGVAVGGDGTVYIADTGNHRVRAVSVDGIIRTVAGGGTVPGDGGIAVSAVLRKPVAIVVDASGDIYIADVGDFRVRRVDIAGHVATVAGTGVQGNRGDGGQAVDAELDAPSSLAFDPGGSLLIGDRRGGVVRAVGTDGVIRTVVSGTAAVGLPGSIKPTSVGSSADSSLYIADSETHRVLRQSTSVLGTEIGSGDQGRSAEGVSVEDASLDHPAAVTVGVAGEVVVGERAGSISRVENPELDFSSVTVGSSAMQGIQLTNTGDAVLRVSQVYVPSSFTLKEGGCGSLPIELAPAQSCTAQIEFASATAGNFTGTVVFSGSGFLARSVQISARAVASNTPAPITTTTTLQVAANGYANQPLTMTANVFVSGSGTPTGTVQFFEAAALLGSVPLRNGEAGWVIASPVVGTHSFTAVYSGDSVFAASRSAAMVSVVGGNAPEFVLTAITPSNSPIAVAAGAPALFQFEITPSGGSYQQMVTFSAQNVPADVNVAFDPATVVPGDNPQTILMTIKVVQSSMAGSVYVVVLACGIPVIFFRKKICTAACLSIFLFGCAGHPASTNSSKETTGITKITILATSRSALGNTLVRYLTIYLSVR